MHKIFNLLCIYSNIHTKNIDYSVYIFYFYINKKSKIIILGVSDWLSPKIKVEPKIIRIAFVLAVLLAGFGLGLYLILWIIKLLSK